MSRKYPCRQCGGETQRNEEHDAFFCTKCDVWRDAVCGESDCEFCVGRPMKPSERRSQEVSAAGTAPSASVLMAKAVLVRAYLTKVHHDRKINDWLCSAELDEKVDWHDELVAACAVEFFHAIGPDSAHRVGRYFGIDSLVERAFPSFWEAWLASDTTEPSIRHINAMDQRRAWWAAYRFLADTKGLSSFPPFLVCPDGSGPPEGLDELRWQHKAGMTIVVGVGIVSPGKPEGGDDGR